MRTLCSRLLRLLGAYLARCLIFLRFLFNRRMRFFLHLPLILQPTEQHRTEKRAEKTSAAVAGSETAIG